MLLTSCGGAELQASVPAAQCLTGVAVSLETVVVDSLVVTAYARELPTLTIFVVAIIS